MMKTNREVLTELIERAELLIQRNVQSSDPDFAAWHNKCIRFLSACYGAKSYQTQSFGKMHFTLTCFGTHTPGWKWNEACVNDLKRAKAIFVDYLSELEDGNISYLESCSNRNSKDVFVVHGHDGELKESVARLINRIGLKAIILSEQANEGLTIIEKFEKYSNVSAAICLFTADDQVLIEDEESGMRARQNVVFETGYFCGKLGRGRIVMLADRGVELPSDMQGVVYTDVSSWQFEVCKELKAMGFAIDLNLLA